jgi:hypothetical protein
MGLPSYAGKGHPARAPVLLGGVSVVRGEGIGSSRIEDI